jgi:hypothetical protein
MIINWECVECESPNQKIISHWATVRDGAFFESSCIECDAEVEVLVEVNTRTI